MIYAIILLGATCLGLCCYVFAIQQKLRQKVELDQQQQAQNKILLETGKILKEKANQLQEQYSQIQQEKQEAEQRLTGIRSAVEAQQNVLKSLSATSEQLRQDATKQAGEVYQEKLDALASDYEKKEQEYKLKYEQVVAILNKQILQEKGKLEDLEAKQRAYIEAQKRAEEIRARKDYYRLYLTDCDVSDIQLLRDLQIRFVRKDVIDKMIWEVYYKPAFDILTGKIFHVDKVCGIYKITCLENEQAYIGQSVDIKERFRQHIKSGLSYATTTNKLYQELYKLGPENFTFEILEEVPREKLNERETYWIEFYKTKEVGYNSTRGGA